MRNLRRALSLALASVMVLGLMIVGSNALTADFGDADQVDEQYTEAIDVLSTVGLIDGMGDTESNFEPLGTLTRAQAAKLLAVMLLGEANAEALPKNTQIFDDVASGSWAAGFIAYCDSVGILHGNGDGTFLPDDALTGVQFGKMLLVALGYDAKIEGYVDNNAWSVNVATDMLEAGIDVEEIRYSDPITREQAAQMVFNTICAPMVEYVNSVNNVVNRQYSTTTLAKEQWISRQKLSNSDYYTVEFGEKYFTKLELNDEYDAFERPILTWVYDQKDITSKINEDLLIKSYTSNVEYKDVYEILGSKIVEDPDLKLEVYVDGESTKEISLSNITRNNDDNIVYTGNGVLTQVFYDTDVKKLTITIVNTYLADTSEYDEDHSTLSLVDYGYPVNDESKYNSVKDIKKTDITNIADYSDQMVLVTISKGEVQTIKTADSLKDAEISSFGKYSYIVVDSTQYNYGETGNLVDSYGIDELKDYDKSNLDDTTYDIYFDEYGYIIGIKKNNDSAKYVFITGTDLNSSNLSNVFADAYAIFTDGTDATIKVNVGKSTLTGVGAPNWNLTSSGNPVVNSWYEYEIKNDSYILTYVEEQFRAIKGTTDNKIIDKTNIGLKDPTNKWHYGNAKTNYILADVDEVTTNTTDYAVISGVGFVSNGVKNTSIEIWDTSDVANELDASPATKYDSPNNTRASYGAYVLYAGNGNFINAAIVVGEGSGSNRGYAYLYGAPNKETYDKVEKVYTWEQNAIIDGNKTTVTFKSELPAQDDFTEDLYEIKYDNDGFAVDATPASTNYFNDYNQSPSTVKYLMYNASTSKNIKTTLSVEGESLWVTNNTDKQGIALNEDAKGIIILHSADNKYNVESVNAYVTVERAVKALEDREDYRGSLVILVDSNGLATSVIFLDQAMLDNEVPTNGYVVPEDRVKNTDGYSSSGADSYIKTLTEGLYQVTSPEAIGSGDANGNAKDVLVIVFKAPGNADANLVITDTTGKPVYTEKMSTPSNGTHYFYVTLRNSDDPDASISNSGDGPMKTAGLDAGNYTVTVSCGTEYTMTESFTVSN